jgi:hypothetical protein
VYGKNISSIPIINSTNTSSFFTGILWDMTDPHPGEYNGSQDVVFLTSINQQQRGKYGVYDYEIRVPVLLREYREDASESVSFYAELK